MRRQKESAVKDCTKEYGTAIFAVRSVISLLGEETDGAEWNIQHKKPFVNTAASI
jgi:hypothetical protein